MCLNQHNGGANHLFEVNSEPYVLEKLNNF